MNATLHIASLLVHCRPELLAAVKANLSLLPGLDCTSKAPTASWWSYWKPSMKAASSMRSSTSSTCLACSMPH